MTTLVRSLGIACMVCALLLVTVGSVGFSSASVDRDVSTSVVSDDVAYVGYDSPETIETQDGEVAVLVTVANRLAQEITVTDIEIHAPSDLDVRLDSSPGDISVGNVGEIEAEIGCDDPVADAAVHVTISLEGSSVTATVFGDAETRTLSLTCQPEPKATAVTFTEDGNAEIHTDSDRDPFTEEFVIRVLGPDGSVEETTAELSTDSEIGDQIDGLDDSVIIGVASADGDEWYVNPGFDAAECSVDGNATETVSSTSSTAPECE